MAIFRRKQNLPPPAPEEGHANLAKQVGFEATPPQVSGQPHKTIAATPAVTQAEAEKPIYEFETTVQRDIKRNRGWYVGWALFFAAAIGLNIWLKQYLGAVTFTILAIILFVTVSQKPNRIKVGFYAKGLALGDKRYFWHEFENFWILHEPPELNCLHLKRRTRVLNELTIELKDESPLKIRDVLLAWLPEDPTREESRVDYVTRSLKL